MTARRTKLSSKCSKLSGALTIDMDHASNANVAGFILELLHLGKDLWHLVFNECNSSICGLVVVEGQLRRVRFCQPWSSWRSPKHFA